MENKIPEILPGTGYYTGGITPFFGPKDVCYHLVKDRSDRPPHNVNFKFPGGRALPSDFDDDIWFANFKEILKRVGFNIDEQNIIIKTLKKLKPDQYHRTFIREYTGETGYFPTHFYFLDYTDIYDNEKKNGSRFYNLFFKVDELVEPESKSANKNKNTDGLCIVESIMADEKFISIDTGVVDARVCVPLSEIPQKLVPSHHSPFKTSFEKDCKDGEKFKKYFWGKEDLVRKLRISRN